VIARVFGQYMFRSSYPGSVSLTLSSQPVGPSQQVIGTSSNFQCNVCAGGVDFNSPAYQAGWPGYRVGKINELKLTVSTLDSNPVQWCIGTVVLALQYRSLGKGDNAQLFPLPSL